MRRTSPEGLQVSGRRGCGSGGSAARARGKKKGDAGSVWEVVSTLASALTAARDQLVTLINNSTAAATQMSGGGCSSCTRHPRSSNSPYPGAGPWVRNVHRGHAHGHVAFGCSSEYRMHPSPVRVKPPRSLFRVEITPPPEPKPPPRRCAHPLHRMHVLPLRGGGSPRPSSSPCQARPPAQRRNVSPDPRRHCIGTQYAALLREESHRLRQRRVTDQCGRGRRLPWDSC